jgi:hypothetical protein
MRRSLLILLTALFVVAPASAKDPKPKSVTQSGVLAARTSTSVTVQDGGKQLKCTLNGSSPKLGEAHVGDRVRLTCKNGVLTAFAKLDAPKSDTPQTEPPKTDPPKTEPPTTEPPRTEPPQTDPPKTDPPRTDPPKPEPTVVQTMLGTLTARNDASVTVHNDERDLTCTRGAASPPLGDLRVGDRVKLACTNGVLTAIARAETPPPAPTPTPTPTPTPAPAPAPTPTPTVTTMTTGELISLSPTSLTVRSDGGERSCSRTGASPSLDGYHVGDRVKVTCVNGVLTAIARL